MNKSRPMDRSIGMDASVTRRDFLGATLLASGAMLEGLSPDHRYSILEAHRAVGQLLDRVLTG